MLTRLIERRYMRVQTKAERDRGSSFEFVYGNRWRPGTDLSGVIFRKDEVPTIGHHVVHTKDRPEIKWLMTNRYLVETFREVL